MEANALAGADVVTVPVGTGQISLLTLGAGTNAAATGDLDISETLTIVGNCVVIDGVSDDRIFHILNTITADTSGVTLTHGSELVGGAIYNQGDLTLSDCRLLDNVASSEGGAIKNIGPGSLVMTGCELSGNEADSGGAIYSVTDLYIADSDIVQNEAFLFGGGIFVSAPTGTDITDSYIGENIAGERGGRGHRGLHDRRSSDGRRVRRVPGPESPG